MKGKMLILIIVVSTILIMALVWFMLKDVMQKHDVDYNSIEYEKYI